MKRGSTLIACANDICAESPSKEAAAQTSQSDDNGVTVPVRRSLGGGLPSDHDQDAFSTAGQPASLSGIASRCTLLFNDVLVL